MPSTEENIERNLAESLARIRILTAKKVDNQIAKVTADPEKCKIKAKSKLSGKPMVDSLNKIATWLRHFEKQEEYKPKPKEKITILASFTANKLDNIGNWRDGNNNMTDPNNNLKWKHAGVDVVGHDMAEFRRKFDSDKTKQMEEMSARGAFQYSDWQPACGNATLKEQLDVQFWKYRHRRDPRQDITPRKITRDIKYRVLDEIVEVEATQRKREECIVELRHKNTWTKKYTQQKGTLLWYDAGSKYGFCQDPNGRSYYCHGSSFKEEYRCDNIEKQDIIRRPKYMAGQSVIFDVVNTPGGEVEAINIQPLGRADFVEKYNVDAEKRDVKKEEAGEVPAKVEPALATATVVAPAALKTETNRAEMMPKPVT